MEHVDLDGARKSVCACLDEHPAGSYTETAACLQENYPEFPEEMAVVLRGMMAAELGHRPSPVISPDSTAAAGALR